MVCDNLLRLQGEHSQDGMVGCEIESLLIIDRSTDLIAPMCSQLTYEGLLDEVFGIDNSSTFTAFPLLLRSVLLCTGIALLPPPHLMPKDANGKPLSAELNSSDSVRVPRDMYGRST